MKCRESQRKSFAGPSTGHQPVRVRCAVAVADDAAGGDGAWSAHPGPNFRLNDSRCDSNNNINKITRSNSSGNRGKHNIHHYSSNPQQHHR
ncbi:uncharacterized protein Dana_GF26802 [Drosophila ananassae]|uniref:Uncharacterized protein n=1 Tax=Drosophila ananassae TaxID=7217 RepID=A0A0P8XYI5_DROAN|nr:uncharacterized protein Dana_GF26802 [Drosophila ananassae]